MSRASDRIGVFVGLSKADEQQEKFDILSELAARGSLPMPMAIRRCATTR